MPARERSISEAILGKYFSGMLLLAAGLGIFDRSHLVTGFISVGLFILGAFFLSVAQVKPMDHAVRYQRWRSWRTVPYSEIQECGEWWMYGYIRLHHYVFPWDRIYFLRARSSDSMFGLDKEIISAIRKKSHV
jgi:hypothetical protein